MIKLLIGGSPCTFWSIAKNDGRETEPHGIGWELFKNYRIAKEKFKPDFFLYENNKSAAQPIKEQISRELGVDLMYINSTLVSAQNRQRFYAFNWEVEQPEDRDIQLTDILEIGLNYKNVGECITIQNAIPKLVKKYGYLPEMFNAYNLSEITEKSPTLSTGSMVTSSCATTLFVKTENGVYKVKDGFIKIGGDLYPTKLKDGCYILRQLSITECCRLQTMPDDYCRAVSEAQGKKGIGNGWSAEVIIHILNGALKDVPKDEEIVVLSMYDGIGTGRYCLDKMGFMQGLKRYTVTYCKYGEKRMKPTDIWTNHPCPNFIPPCKNGDTCHERAPRGSRTGTQGLANKVEKARIPKALCDHIAKICEVVL